MSDEAVHILKFAVVGTVGFLVNTTGLFVGVRIGLRPSLAGPVGAELAILSNFLLNNFWTFSDRRITSWDQVPGKFLTFNVLSFGSVIIQFLFLRVGEAILGLKTFKEPFLKIAWIRKLPLVGFVTKLPVLGRLANKFSAYFVFYMAGIGVGLAVNYIIYSRIIWR